MEKNLFSRGRYCQCHTALVIQYMSKTYLYTRKEKLYFARAQFKICFKF